MIFDVRQKECQSVCSKRRYRSLFANITYCLCFYFTPHLGGFISNCIQWNLTNTLVVSLCVCVCVCLLRSIHEFFGWILQVWKFDFVETLKPYWFTYTADCFVSLVIFRYNNLVHCVLQLNILTFNILPINRIARVYR